MYFGRSCILYKFASFRQDAMEDLKVPGRSVIKIPVKVKSARGKKMPCTTFGISTMAHDRLGVWDSLSKVDSEARRVFSVFINAC